MNAMEDMDGGGPNHELYFTPEPEREHEPEHEPDPEPEPEPEPRPESSSVHAPRRRSARISYQEDGEDSSGSEFEPEVNAQVPPTAGVVRKSLKRSAEGLTPAPDKQKGTKKTRTSGGRQPTSKRIVPDYDSEDEIIMQMKQAGYADQDVATRLINDGRTAYDPKSISSRWQRMRKCVQAAEDELLDEELTDWHEGEDDLLNAAYQKAEAKQASEIEKVKSKLFTFVAHEINKTAARPRFSARACKNRHEALEAGTARVPPELDEDPQARLEERAEKIKAFKLRKAEEAEAAQVEAAEMKKAKIQSAKDKDEARQKRMSDAATRSQRRKADYEFKKTRLTVAAEKRKNKEDDHNLETARRAYKQRKAHFENELLKRLQREQKARERALNKFSTQFPLPEGAGVIISRPPPRAPLTLAPEDGILLHRSTTVEPLNNVEIAEQELALNALLKSQPKVSFREQKAAEVAAQKQKDIDAASLMGANPREWLSLDELWDILRDRAMLLVRMKQVKSVVLSRIEEDDRKRSREEMMVFCSRAGISIQGTKAELVRRLAEHEARHSRKWQKNYGPRLPVAEAKQARADAKAKREADAAAGIVPSRFTARGLSEKRYSARNTAEEFQQQVEQFQQQVEQMRALTGAPSENAGNKASGSKTPGNKISGNKTPGPAKRRTTRKSIQTPMADSPGFDGTFDYFRNNIVPHIENEGLQIPGEESEAGHQDEENDIYSEQEEPYSGSDWDGNL